MRTFLFATFLLILSSGAYAVRPGMKLCQAGMGGPMFEVPKSQVCAYRDGFSFRRAVEQGELNELAAAPADFSPRITCAQDLFGRYAQCSGLPLGQLCAIQKGKKIVWGSCRAADSDDRGDIYCLCR